MTNTTLRTFIDTSMPIATALSGLTAALDAKAHGVPLDPDLGARIGELLAAVGADGALDGLSQEEALETLLEVRHLLTANTHLHHVGSRKVAWTYADDRFLQEVGDFARGHAKGLLEGIVPKLDGLDARLRAPGGAFLDIGVGVAGLAVEFARRSPHTRIVGIDVFPAALRLAHGNVAQAGLQERIELREQAAEELDDEEAFDLIWVPMPFMPERGIPTALRRAHRAARKGGWIAISRASFGTLAEPANSMWRLRTTAWGGSLWENGRVEAELREAGFENVRTLQAPPGVPVAITAGQRSG